MHRRHRRHPCPPPPCSSVPSQRPGLSRVRWRGVSFLRKSAAALCPHSFWKSRPLPRARLLLVFGDSGGPLSLMPCWIQRSRGTAASRQGWVPRSGGRSAPSCPHPGAVPAPPLLLVGPHEYTFRNESWLGACACAAPPAASSPGQAQSQRLRQGRAWRPPAWCRRVCLRRCRGHLPSHDPKHEDVPAVASCLKGWKVLWLSEGTSCG